LRVDAVGERIIAVAVTVTITIAVAITITITITIARVTVAITRVTVTVADLAGPGLAGLAVVGACGFGRGLGRGLVARAEGEVIAATCEAAEQAGGCDQTKRSEGL